MISEFHARWDKLNNYLDEFPPFWPNQQLQRIKPKTTSTTSSKALAVLSTMWQVWHNRMFHQRFFCHDGMLSTHRSTWSFAWTTKPIKSQ
jgi:hypothetical protein